MNNDNLGGELNDQKDMDEVSVLASEETDEAQNERMGMALVIKNVAIPVTLDDTFIAPDLEAALEYYPEWVRLSRCGWTIQGYLCELMKEIDKTRPNGYDSIKAVGEFLLWAGFERFSELMAQKSGRPTVRLMV